MEDIAGLKARVSFRALVEESHTLDRSGKVHCPYHDDRHPSCHIYPDGFKCFACGVYGDHLDWLEQVYSLSTAAAITALKQRAGSAGTRPATARRPVGRAKPLEPTPLSERELRPYLRRLKRSKRVPGSLAGRSLAPADLKRLGIAVAGEDALFPILDPEGRTVALKRRFHRAAGGRYAYHSAGHGSPAWASPGCLEQRDVLVMEGELNGMVAWLALQEAGRPVAVVAPAGAYGRLYPSVLRGRRVFLYADDDEAGRQALARWRVAALRAGAAQVVELAPFEVDACDLAGRHGRGALARRLERAMAGPVPAAAPSEELACSP